MYETLLLHWQNKNVSWQGERPPRHPHVPTTRVGGNGRIGVLLVDATSPILHVTVLARRNYPVMMIIWMQPTRIHRAATLTETTYGCSGLTQLLADHVPNAALIDGVGERSRKKYVRL